MIWLLLLSLLGCAAHRSPGPGKATLADYGAELWVGKGERHLVVVEWYSPQVHAAARADLLPVLQGGWCRPDDSACADRFAKRIARAERVAADPVLYDVSVWLALGPSSLDRSPTCEAKGITSRTPPLEIACKGHPTKTFTVRAVEDGVRFQMSEDLARGRTPDVTLARANPVAVAFDVADGGTGGSPELAWVGELAEAAQDASEFSVTSVTAAIQRRQVNPGTVRWKSVRRVVKRMEPLVFRLPAMPADEQAAVIQEAVDAELR